MERRKLEGIIRFLVAAHEGRWIGRIKLVKLVFLTDYESFRRHGATITGVQWEQHLYGPFAREIISTAQGLPDIVEQARTTLKGHTTYAYAIASPPAGEALDGLTDDERRVAEDVFAEWGQEWWEAILAHVHSLPFVEQFACGEQLDWSAFVEEEDLVMTDEARQRARARLEALREGAASTPGPDDDPPYEWSDEAAAEMRENVQLARQLLARLADKR